MKRLMILTILLSSTLILSGCHDNPLKAMTKDKQIAFLMQASRSAEKVMGVFSEPGGAYYLSCMQEEDISVDCQKFFKHMLSYAHTQKEFANLKLAQLTDPNLIADIAIEYQNIFFNTI
ncbi:hypothetical protein [Legionella longbeachae]|uniref:hypothetical protein n=1 Tax=Legionella longbeachae TaxID=450 RepID=UPI0001BEBC94|nr:hypothetical protein [Legionella longbeachae]EEZ95950.1 Legionella vir region protein LvrD [Legionella longbeachae D-4968]